MNITKEQADKVIAALSMNRIMARDENGNYTKEITAQVVVEALSIMRGLAEDAEPVAWMWQHDETGLTGFVDCWNVENNWQKNNPRLRLIGPLYTSPQAAQTEAQEREAWLRVCREIIDRWVAPDMYKYAVAMLDLAIQADQAGRAGSKP